jgi:transcriptional regulator with XRE-family HTH domain
MYGQRLRELRKESGKTMKEFGKIFNLAESTISGYETESRRPDMDIMQKFADYHDVSIDYIMGRSNIKNPDKQPEGRFFYDLGNASEEDLDELENYFKFMQERKQKRENKRNE